jgi:hypothetical protein
MDGTELDTLQTISRWTIAIYVTVIAVTLAFGLDGALVLMG